MSSFHDRGTLRLQHARELLLEEMGLGTIGGTKDQWPLCSVTSKTRQKENMERKRNGTGDGQSAMIKRLLWMQ